MIRIQFQNIFLGPYSPLLKVGTFLVWSKFVKSAKVWLFPCARFLTEICVQKGLFFKFVHNIATKWSIKPLLVEEKYEVEPLSVNFWDHHRARFLEKSKNTACDVTVRTKKIKIICADRVLVEVSYDANFKWHMPI